MKKVIAVILVSVALSISGLALWMAADITGFSEFIASRCVGRKVTIGRVSLTGPSLDARDIHVKNAAWAAEPDMIYIRHLHAAPDWASLLAGHATFRQMMVEDASLLLERDASGAGNWKKNASQKPSDPQTEGRRSRESFPVLLDLSVKNSHIAMRTSSGAQLKIDLTDMTLQTPARDQPVHLTVSGAYNGLPVEGQIDTQSFDILHDALEPFHGAILARGKDISLAIDANFMDPINFDQFNGNMHIAVTNIGAAASYFGGPFNWARNLLLDGAVTRRTDHWQVAAATGNLAGNKFNDSRIQLDEGARKQPDRIATEFNFDKIDISSLLDTKTHQTAQPKTGDKASPLNSSDAPSTLVDATVTARDFFGGNLKTKFNRQEKKATLDIDAVHMDMQKMLQILYQGRPFLNGFLNIKAHVEAGGDNGNALSQTIGGKIAATMKEAYVARWANHLAATNLRGLFENKTDTLPIQCFAAQIAFKNGYGVLDPFVLKTGEGVLRGGGFIDVPQDKMTLVFATDPKTTSEFALDAPIQLSGTLSHPVLGLASNHNMHATQNCP